MLGEFAEDLVPFTPKRARHATRLIGSVSLLVAGAVLGCSDAPVEPCGCPNYAKPGSAVAVEDAAWGSPLDSALAVATEGSYADSAVSPGDPPLAVLAHGRPGTYVVSMERRGHAAREESGIAVVTEGDCRPVDMVQLTVRLVAPSE